MRLSLGELAAWLGMAASFQSRLGSTWACDGGLVHDASTETLGQCFAMLSRLEIRDSQGPAPSLGGIEYSLCVPGPSIRSLRSMFAVKKSP